MKQINKTVKVLACEICSKEIEESLEEPFLVIEPAYDGKVAVGTAAKYYFHKKCVNEILIKTAKNG